jgi:lysophospholipase L1-like esterase
LFASSALGAAAAVLSLTGDAGQLGHIHLTASAPEGATGLRIVEVVPGGDVQLAEGAEAVTDWTCERSRTFAAVTDYQRSEPFVAATPSCADRLQLRVLRRGRNLRVTVHDRWHLGGVPTRLCVRPPRGIAACRGLAVGPGQWEASHVFPAPAIGRWTVRLAALGHRSVRRVSVRPGRRSTRPLVLTTGDSMMLTLSSVLERRLRARVRADIYIGSGVSKAAVVNWARLPAQQLRAEHQDATVLTVGMGDVYPLGEIPCCGEAWAAEYARRARRMMRAYTRRGATLVWLNLPYPRDPGHAPAVTSVNAAVAAAAVALPRVRVVDLAAMLTPGGVYRQAMLRGDHRVRLRRADGVHLAPGGARLVARAVTRELVDLGVLPATS